MRARIRTRIYVRVRPACAVHPSHVCARTKRSRVYQSHRDGEATASPAPVASPPAHVVVVVFGNASRSFRHRRDAVAWYIAGCQITSFPQRQAERTPGTSRSIARRFSVSRLSLSLCPSRSLPYHHGRYTIIAPIGIARYIRGNGRCAAF